MVDGLDRLQRRFAAIPESVRAAAVQAMEQSAAEVVQLMRQWVPKDTGAGAASINWTWGDAPKGAMTLGTFKGKQRGSLQITIYAGGETPLGDAFYLRFQEFGTVKMPANAFFFPAWRAKRTKAKARLTRAIRKAIKEA